MGLPEPLRIVNSTTTGWRRVIGPSTATRLRSTVSSQTPTPASPIHTNPISRRALRRHETGVLMGFIPHQLMPNSWKRNDAGGHTALRNRVTVLVCAAYLGYGPRDLEWPHQDDWTPT